MGSWVVHCTGHSIPELFRRFCQGFYAFERYFVRKSPWPCDCIKPILSMHGRTSAIRTVYAACSPVFCSRWRTTTRAFRVTSTVSHSWLLDLPTDHDECLSYVLLPPRRIAGRPSFS